jgi:arsenate reductase (thioredoxin)
MAEAFLNQRCADEIAAESAGLEPGELSPLAVAAMKEVGIDVSGKATKSISEVLQSGRHYDYIVTVCDDAEAERCPVFSGGGKRLHWSFPDPSTLQGSWDERLAKTRNIRDAIQARVESWCGEIC